MCCNSLCLTSCGCTSTGGGCGFCSECVGNASCQTALCSCCLTGAVTCTPVCTPTPGTGTCICTNSSTSCINTCIACLAYAGQDSSGNDIYQNPDGSLRYADGSPATRGDIACNCGACTGTPCGPQTHGATCMPPSSSGGGKAAGAPSGGGSGGGTAKPSMGKSNPAGCTQMSKLSQAMSRFGASITSLLSGGKGTAVKNVLPGQAVQKNVLGISPNSYLLVIIIVGGLLLWMAFGHKPTAD
jgi:hypothetical protein